MIAAGASCSNAVRPGLVGSSARAQLSAAVASARSARLGALDLRLALCAGEEQELTAAEVEDAGLLSVEIDVVKEALARSVGARSGHQSNMSYFAFTATPKGRTLEMFGRLNPQTQVYDPFHLYSVKQAIEEGFTMDVVWRFDGLLRTLAIDGKRRPQQRLAAWRAVSLSGKRSSGPRS